MFALLISGCDHFESNPGAEGSPKTIAQASSKPVAAPSDTVTRRWAQLARATADSAVFREKYTGAWTTALLAQRLIEAGFAVFLTDSTINYQHLSVPGKYIRLGRGDVHAFFYPDTAKARVDAARLDSATAAPPGVVVQWPKAVTLVRNLNLVVIFLSDSDMSSERLTNAVLGGLMPPPESLK